MGEKVICVVATLDTKGNEVKYLKERIESKGFKAFVVDGGVLGEPQAVKADVTREEVAAAASSQLEVLKTAGRGHAVESMASGAAKVVSELYRKGRVHGVLSIGGAEGTILGTEVMKALPVGVPKFMVSTMASGQQAFGEYTGTKDVIMMHSVTDILGVNSVSKKIFDNAVAAICGMVAEEVGSIESLKDDISTRRVSAMMYGNTTPAVMRAKGILESHGYEVIVFHSNGTGGPAMEEFIRQGVFHGVLDMTTHEITDYLVGGMHSGGPTRLEAAGEMGIPQLVVPGCVEFIIQGALETLPEKFRGRPYYYHNRTCTIVSTTVDEIREVGKVMAAKLNKAKGPTTVAIPLRGLSQVNRPGETIFDPDRDKVLFETLKSNLRSDIPVVEVDAHINDPKFADTVAPILIEMMEKHYCTRS